MEHTNVFRAIRLESVDTIATMLALRKYLKLKISVAKQIAKLPMGVEIPIEPELVVLSNYTKEEIITKLRNFYIYIK